MHKVGDKKYGSPIFRRHSKETIKRWVDSLRFFYLVKAAGGMANDGDNFVVGIAFSDKQDLLDKLAMLQILDCRQNLDSTVKGMPDIKQIGTAHICGCKVFIWVQHERIEIKVSDGYEVTDACFEDCKKIETFLEKLNLSNSVVDLSEIKGQGLGGGGFVSRCITKKNYPELWE